MTTLNIYPKVSQAGIKCGDLVWYLSHGKGSHRMATNLQGLVASPRRQGSLRAELQVGRLPSPGLAGGKVVLGMPQDHVAQSAADDLRCAPPQHGCQGSTGRGSDITQFILNPLSTGPLRHEGHPQLVQNSHKNNVRTLILVEGCLRVMCYDVPRTVEGY